jgi:hypothetical protein
MFQRDQRVAVSGVQILRSGKQLSVLFEQQWSSSSFADGLVNESTLRSYAPDGRVLSSTSDARFVNSGKRAEPDMYLRSEPPVIAKLGDLPFASALAAAR